MASVPDRSKPKVVREYHVFATKTAVASYLTARRCLVDFLDTRTLKKVLVDIFSAYVYFGMAMLVTPNRQAGQLFQALNKTVLESRDFTQVISGETGRKMGRDIWSGISSKIASVSPSDRPLALMAKVLYDFNSDKENELSIRAGQLIEIVQKDNSGWWLAKQGENQAWVPAAYVEERHIFTSPLSSRTENIKNCQSS
ncbi:SH3 domain containing protein [Naviculisporaceae sp. PSN 640]